MNEEMIWDDYLEDDEEENEVKKEFNIDSIELADWAVKKIVNEQKIFEQYEKAAKSQINELKLNIKEEERKSRDKQSFLLAKLNEYMNRDDVAVKKTKTQMSLKLPSGTVQSKFEKDDFITDMGDNKFADNQTLIKFCKKNCPEYIETKESVNWSELKKVLTIIDGNIVMDTGEIIDAIQITRTPVEVKVKR